MQFNMPQFISTISAAITIVLGLAAAMGAVVYFRTTYKAAKTNGKEKVSNEAISTLQTTVEALKTQNEIQASQIKDQDAKVAKLSGTVDTLKDIPLGKIEQHMALQSTQMEAMNKILENIVPLIPSIVQHTVTEITTTKK